MIQNRCIQKFKMPYNFMNIFNLCERLSETMDNKIFKVLKDRVNSFSKEDIKIVGTAQQFSNPLIDKYFEKK